MLERRVFGDAGARVVVEEYLEGEEVSVFALTDGRTVCPLASAQDHKAVFDGDRGPNTGGMGAYSPAPVLDDAALADEVLRTVLEPTVRAMAAEGRPTAACSTRASCSRPDGPRVLEYNVRFGDPECQVLMLRLADDLLPLCQAVAAGRGLPPSVRWRPEAAVCVVIASGGYPGRVSDRPARSTGSSAPRAHPGVTVFHAGTARRDGRLVTAGGRVLGVTALGADIRAAVDRRLRRGGGDPLRGRALPARHRPPRPPAPRPAPGPARMLREPPGAARRRREPPSPRRRSRRRPGCSGRAGSSPSRPRRSTDSGRTRSMRRRWPASSRPRAGPADKPLLVLVDSDRDGRSAWSARCRLAPAG